MKIVITGSNGFIGSHLVLHLQKNKNNKIVCFDKSKHSLQSVKSLSHLLKKADLVYHLAAINNSEDPHLFDVNAMGTINLLKAIKVAASPNCKIIFTSSFSVYKTPKKNDVITENFEIYPQTLYGLSKQFSEEAIKFYSYTFNIPYIILRISNPYGPGVPSFKHSVVGTFFELIKTRRKITIHGNGNQTRDFIFIDDVILALEKASGKKVINEILNIASGKSISISKLLDLIEQMENVKSKVEKKPSHKAVGYWNVNTEKAKKVLQWKAETDIMEGLKKTWEYNNQ